MKDRVITALVKLGREITKEGQNPSDAPAVLYHYTGVKGLLGIIKDSKIRVSRAACLNDRNEISYGTTLAKKVLAERSRRHSSSLLRHFHRHADDSKYRSPIRLDPFVASFCSEPDLIGMWAYFARDGGYCLGFKTSALTFTKPPEQGQLEFGLCKVIYDEDEQRDLFNSAIGRCERLLEIELQGTSDNHQIAAGAIAMQMLEMVILNLSARMKAPPFFHEKEWRLFSITTEGPDTDDPNGEDEAFNMEFRVVGSRLIPYFNATYDPGRAPIVSVHSGPTVDGEIAKDSISRLLKKYQHDWTRIKISSSDISLRD